MQEASIDDLLTIIDNLKAEIQSKDSEINSLKHNLVSIQSALSYKIRLNRQINHIIISARKLIGDYTSRSFGDFMNERAFCDILLDILNQADINTSQDSISKDNRAIEMLPVNIGDKVYIQSLNSYFDVLEYRTTAINNTDSYRFFSRCSNYNDDKCKCCNKRFYEFSINEVGNNVVKS